MRQCTHCQPRHARPYPESRDPGPLLGDVYSIRESMHAPLILLLGLCNIPSMTRYFTDLLVSRGKIRPCAIIDLYKENGNTMVTVCAMGTFGGADIDSLPFVFRHFLVPIYPNGGSGDALHIHTIPEWKAGRPGWLLAVKLNTDRTLRRRWPSATGPSPSFSSATVKHIRDLCHWKMKQWKDMCHADPSFLDEQRREYMVSLNLNQRTMNRCQRPRPPAGSRHDAKIMALSYASVAFAATLALCNHCAVCMLTSSGILSSARF
ncbi:uncharacterized protein LAESUDRAFT_488457 [Laetiporus sulphureus 93-53]|uniref:Uncharacterized protein n=1 Tax=Laetiporus sulphureus 93-53 TaxID=1314785 RepID=A0A165BJU4_9APHY|nr:uncharacterized protein LAESUDRAFT_488457 [Laetiporus sulphureus 93-53]KZT01193.1 hypothetical protein LAESUDRAFT_488457 [Laetiporus sulphureus 93-53]